VLICGGDVRPREDQLIRLIHYVFAALRLMAPFMAIIRLLIASVYAGATIAGIHAVAAITFALLMTVLYIGTIARPIG
jgi:predicted CDP-diglyceride synthetase/phosphatidate cytidylyltransferase